MVSIELLRRYPFFAGFSTKQLTILANVGEELLVDVGHYFFHEGDELGNFYMVVEGNVHITVDIPDRKFKQSLVQQLTNNLTMTEITVSIVGPGHTFGWSALIPPNISTANAKAGIASRLLGFDRKMLQSAIDKDCCFEHLLTLKAAQVVRQRLHDMRIETLAERV
ncbi:MAG: Crp/Fnr family transcriptional regulator [Chloroflexota bacterium]